MRSARRRPTTPGCGIGMRKSTTPQRAGSCEALASSPKSLSKVSKTRSARTARASTSVSVSPGAAVLTQTTSCPAAPRAVTAGPGKFSFARNRISSGAREDLFAAQRVSRVGKTGEDVFARKPGVVGENIGLAPAIGHQADDELDGEAGPADHGLAGEHLRVER